MLFYTTRNLKPKRNEITLAQIVQDTAQRECVYQEKEQSPPVALMGPIGKSRDPTSGILHIGPLELHKKHFDHF